MTSTPVIQTRDLTKSYGSAAAVRGLNLSVEPNCITAFLGQNGAGKSTTIKILATLLQPTWGEARICDYVVGYQSRSIRPLIGYVPDYFGAYEDMVIQEYLEFFAAAYNISVRWYMQRRPELFANGYLTTFADFVLNTSMVLVGGGFDSPFSYILFTVTISVANGGGCDGPSLLADLDDPRLRAVEVEIPDEDDFDAVERPEPGVD